MELNMEEISSLLINIRLKDVGNFIDDSDQAATLCAVEYSSFWK